MSNEGQNLKAVHIQLYNGAGGIYAQAMYAWRPYGTIGRMMVANDDSGNTGGVTGGSVATLFWSGGYGVSCLAVAFPEEASIGRHTYNDLISLVGKLKLVTEGEGFFMPAKTAQTYIGGMARNSVWKVR